VLEEPEELVVEEEEEEAEEAIEEEKGPTKLSEADAEEQKFVVEDATI